MEPSNESRKFRLPCKRSRASANLSAESGANRRVKRTRTRYTGRPLTSLPNELLIKISKCLIPYSIDPYVEEGPRDAEYWNSPALLRRPHSPTPKGDQLLLRNSKDLYRLMRSCKILHDVALPFLYETVELDGNRCLKAFLRTVVAKPWLQEKVRSLIIRGSDRSGEHGSGVDRYLKLEYLKFPNLEYLDVEHAGWIFERSSGFMHRFFELAATLPNLHRLTVAGLSHMGPALQWPALSNITELRLFRCYFDAINQRQERVLLGCFPNLRVLIACDSLDAMCHSAFAPVSETLETIVFYEAEIGPDAARFLPKLKHLKVGSNIIDYWSPETMLSPPSLDELESIQVLDVAGMQADIGDQLLKRRKRGFHPCWEMHCNALREAVTTILQLAPLAPKLNTVQLPPIFQADYCQWRQVWDMSKLVAEAREALKEHDVELKVCHSTDGTKACECLSYASDDSEDAAIESSLTREPDGDPASEISSAEFDDTDIDRDVEYNDEDNSAQEQNEYGSDSDGEVGSTMPPASDDDEGAQEEQEEEPSANWANSRHPAGRNLDSYDRVPEGEQEGYLTDDDYEGGWEENEIQFEDY